MTGKTKQEVRDKLKTLHTDLDAGVQTPARYTVQAAVDVWLTEGLSGRSARTVTLYRDGVKPLTDKLGATPLRELTAANVRSALASLSDQLSTRSLQIAHNCLVRAIRHAQADDIIARNVADVRQWPERTWAVEGCRGIGKHIAGRLLAGGEHVVDVPPKLSARTRVFSAGQGRKTDATDAHSIALAATRTTGLRPVTGDEQLEVLRVLADRRRALGEDHTRMICQLHQLLLELIPGGAKKALSAAQAKALLARVRPRDPAGRARRRVAAELISDLERIHQRKKAADKELNAALKAAATTLTSLDGIGPSGAARLLVEAGDINRFPTRAHFASWNGTAPIDASSGDHVRHRLSRAGNRQINRVLHIMAVVQLRHPTKGRAYYDRKAAAGKTPMEAMRALKRRLSDVVYRQMTADARTEMPRAFRTVHPLR